MLTKRPIKSQNNYLSIFPSKLSIISQNSSSKTSKVNFRIDLHRKKQYSINNANFQCQFRTWNFKIYWDVIHYRYFHGKWGLFVPPIQNFIGLTRHATPTESNSSRFPLYSKSKEKALLKEFFPNNCYFVHLTPVLVFSWIPQISTFKSRVNLYLSSLSP